MQNASASSRYFAALLCMALSLAASAPLAAEPPAVSFHHAATVSKAGVGLRFVQQSKRDRTKKESKPAAKAKDDGINLSTVLITGLVSFVLGAGGIYFFVNRQKSQAALEQQRLLTRTGTASGFAYTPVQEAVPVTSPKTSTREVIPAIPAASVSASTTVSAATVPAANASTATVPAASASARTTPSLPDLDTAEANSSDGGNTDEETIIDPFSTAADTDDADLSDAFGQRTSPDDLSANSLDDNFLGDVDVALPVVERSALENQYNAARAGEEQYRFAERMIACTLDGNAASVPVFTEAGNGIFLISRIAAEKENVFEMFVAHRVVASGDETRLNLPLAFTLTRRTGDGPAEETYVKPALVSKHEKGWQLERKGEIIFGI